jgi:hypothetical protein
MSAVIDQTNMAIPKFEKGDAGIILKANGEFVVWNTFENPAAPDEAQLETARKLMGLAAALRLPQVMDVLLQVASDPTIFSQPVNIDSRQ